MQENTFRARNEKTIYINKLLTFFAWQNDLLVRFSMLQFVLIELSQLRLQIVSNLWQVLEARAIGSGHL
jgi:hypothetical protein